MQNDYDVDIIGLIDEDGKEYKFEILDKLEENGRVFYALLPTEDSEIAEVANDGEYYIMEEVMEDGYEAPMLADVDDEDLLDHLAEIFEEHFDEMFDYDLGSEE